MTGQSFPEGFRLESLERSHPRRGFDCGQQEVNHWLRTKALQHQNKRLSTTKALLDADGKMAGFYTLASGQVDFTELPDDLVQELPKRQLPVAIVAWLGVDRSYQGQKLGDLLFARALGDCYKVGKVFAFVAVVLDAVDDRSKSFYQRWRFEELPGNPNRLYLSAAELSLAIESAS